MGTLVFFPTVPVNWLCMAQRGPLRVTRVTQEVSIWLFTLCSRTQYPFYNVTWYRLRIRLLSGVGVGKKNF